jgi:protein gp37
MDMRRNIGKKVFVCSVSDLFAAWTCAEWRDAVLAVVFDRKLSFFTFQLLTKQPQGIPNYLALRPRDNVWVGVTINRNDELWKAAELRKRIGPNAKGFVSFEPLLESIDLGTGSSLEDTFNQIMFRSMNWVIVGKLTGSRKVKFQDEWVQGIIDACREARIPVFVKNNVGWPEKIQEFPDQV